MTIVRDSALDGSASNGSTTTLPCAFAGGGAAVANRWLIGLAFLFDMATNLSNITGWTKRQTAEHNSQTFSIGLYDKLAAGGETGITFATGGSAASMYGMVFSYAGILTASPADVGNAAQSGASQVQAQVTGTTGAVAQPNELTLEAILLNSTAAGTRAWDNAGSPILSLANVAFAGQRIQAAASGAQSDTFRWTNLAFAVSLIQTYKGAPDENTGWETC